MKKINNRTLYDDFIIYSTSVSGGCKIVKKLEGLGYKFNASVEKVDCYYVARRIVFDDKSKEDFKYIEWGRDEVKLSNEFSKMQTYEEFMGEPEPIDKAVIPLRHYLSDKKYKDHKDSDGWVSIKDDDSNVMMDRVPDKGKKVIVRFGDRNIRGGHYETMYGKDYTRNDGTVDIVWDGNIIGATHWRPFPDQPGENSEIKEKILDFISDFDLDSIFSKDQLNEWVKNNA